jgi:hypothetical protein
MPITTVLSGNKYFFLYFSYCAFLNSKIKMEIPDMTPEPFVRLALPPR